MNNTVKRTFFHIGRLFADAELTRDQRTLIAIITLLFFGNGFSGTFVNTFLYASDGGLNSVLVYNIYNYCGVVGAAFIVAFIGRTITMKNCLILGMCFFSAVYALLLCLREAASGYVWLIGLLTALASAFFHIPHASLVFQRTDNRIRDLYFSRQGIFTMIGVLVAPFIAGYAIDMIGGTRGYLFMFSLSLLMYIIAGIIALRLERTRTGGNSRNFLFLTLRLVVVRRNYRAVALASVLRGIREGTMWVLTGTLLFAISNNATVGIYSFVTAGLIVISLYAVQRVLRPHNRSAWLLLATSFMAFSTLLFLFGLTTTIFFVFGVLISFGMAFFNTITASIYCHVTSSLPASNRRSLEGMAIQEIMLNVGRGMSMIAILLLPHTQLFLIYAMIVAGFLQLATWFFYARAEKYTCPECTHDDY